MMDSRILLVVLMSCLAIKAADKQPERTPLPQMTKPISEEMCKEKEYRHLHFCKSDKKKLKSVVEDYRCLFDVISSDDFTASHGNSYNMHAPSSVSVSFNVSSSSSSSSEMSMYVKRYKRSSADERNPCRGPLLQVILYEAYDKDTGEIFELVQRPDDKLYQTFYIRSCSNYAGHGLKCDHHDVIYKTLVYLYPPDVSDEVGTKFVRTRGSCALSFTDT